MVYSVMCYILWLLDLLGCSVITCFAFEPKEVKARRWVHILGLFLVQLPFVTIKFIFNGQPIVRTAGVILVILAALIYTIILFNGYIWQKILFVAFRVICCCVAEWVIQYLFQDILLQMEEINFKQPVVAIYVACTEILFIILFLLFMLMWKQFILKKGYDLKVFFIFIIFPISQIIMMSNINLRVLTEMTPASTAAVISLVLGIVADILLLILLLRQQSMHEMEVKLNEVEKVWEVEQNHYCDIEARREELAKIRHDITELFIIMQELLHRENYDKVVEMLYTLREYVASTKEYAFCADPVVNAIMAENERECRKRGVQIKYNLEIMKPLQINPVVICSIFTNLMRNALAAAEAVEDKTQAYVEIKAAVKGDYLCVKVENTFSNTSKSRKNKTRKGYGLEILRTLADKYHGQMDIEVKDGKYSTYISVENVELNETGIYKF